MIGGDKFGKVYVEFRSRPNFYMEFYNDFVEFVATSNLSKMVPVISLGFCGLGLKNFKLNEKAINIKTKEVSTTYQVDNIHDPNVKVTFCNEGEQYFVKVTIMKE
uniref:Uncharacterized protein n=1 Tax=Meloidogyne incognita TaxID=6306 RepID=A0A914M4G2_MELIC